MLAGHRVRLWRRARWEGQGEEGSFIAAVAILFTFLLALVVATMGLLATRVQDVRISRHLLVARQAAISGLQLAISEIREARDYSSLAAAFQGIAAMDPNPGEGMGGYTLRYDAEPFRDLDGREIAQLDVLVDVRGTDGAERDVAVTCYAYVPTKQAYVDGVRDAVRADAHAIVGAKLHSAAVFDYSYFINHWGWYFGNNIISNGSVRSNGQFDFGNYRSTINGSPRYRDSQGFDLIGYLDDNKDGVTDGSDGGVYSGMAIVRAANIRGMGALAKNQHQYLGGIAMPNLNDLTFYEDKAKTEGSSISLGATKVVDAVLGDDAGEKQHLYLEGTAANPIVLDGPVVVRGSVIISGYVTGQGAIYAKGNVYVPKPLRYVNPPATPRPASNDEATVEAWREANASKDALGLFAAEHVVLGNYTDSSWQSNVKSWINNANNKSNEDAGLDGIHNTKAGLDGILGTADDDVLEGDGVWTVSRYTEADAAAGRIPPGKSVGDVIPGSGEDIDGDGRYDGTIQMSEFNIPAALSSTNWAGNVPAGTPSYGSISTRYVDRLDASFYTNHAFAGYIASSSGDIVFNGSLVSRNESIIYSVPSGKSLLFNHDERLSGRGAEMFGFYTPVTWDPLEVSEWEFDRAVDCDDPSSPDSVVAAYTGGVEP